jgi:GH25 family lysozyme M1 (1,4-beta-N-acetylmuramidase)
MRNRSSALVLIAALVPGCLVGDSGNPEDWGDPTSTGDTGDTGDPADHDATAGAALSALDKAGGGEAASIYARVCAQGATTFGVDVSYYQGNINWTTARAAGVEFAFIRVSDGTGFHDPKFATYWSGAHAAGVIRGPYQFFRPNQNVIAQADLLISAIGGSYTIGDLPPVIDVEATGGLSPSSVATKVRQWVDHVKAALGVDPIVYTGKYFWRDQVGGPTSFATNPLWIAQYTSLCPDLPAPWTNWTFWQSSDSGTVAGISSHVDIDKFNGSLDELAAFAGGTAVTEPPPPPTTCASATLDRDVPESACVQAASDAHWYGCSGGMWVSRASSAGCSEAYGWCSSATLQASVPPRTCVQAASDHVWYQCDGTHWATPVAAGAGPAGTCASEHAL